MPSRNQHRAVELIKTGFQACNAKAFDRADEAFRTALELWPEHPNALSGLAVVAWYQYRDRDRALACFDAAVAAAPTNVEAIVNRANFAKILRDDQLAIESARRVLQLDPCYLRAYQIIQSLVGIKIADDDYRQLENISVSASLSDADRAQVHFMLGSIHEQAGEYKKAFMHFRTANEFKRSKKQFADELSMNKFFYHALGNSLPLAALPVAEDAPRMLFIVGMPRSGSTLLEQILTTRPEVGSVGEAAFFPTVLSALVNDAYPHGLRGHARPAQLARHLTPRRLRAMQSDYLERVRCVHFATPTTCVVDKMLGNFHAVPLLLALFPDACIIHARRHPLDVGLSCFVQDFVEVDYSNSLAKIGMMYRQYAEIIEGWQQRFPHRIHTVRYERLTMEQEGEARALLDFCGLPFDEAALHPEQSANVVQTASVHQVDKPIYRSSVGRWRRYVDELEPLIAALGGWDWINAHADEPCH